MTKGKTMPRGWMHRLQGFLFKEDHRLAKGLVEHRLRQVGRLLYLSLWKFQRDFCFDRAASLAFASILSMIPLSVLFVSFVGLLGGGERIMHFVQQKILPAVVPEFQHQVMEWLESSISPTVFKAGPAGLINLAALLGLIMGALNILITAERVFNHIWRVQGSRHYFQKVTAFWVLLTSSPFVIVASMWISNVLVPQGGAVESFLQRNFLARTLYSLCAPVFVETICFALIYFYLPSARVRFRNAVLAGLCAAVLWELSKKGFYFYVSQAGTMTNFYRNLATVPLFFVWLFLTWIILLWGGQLSYALQNAKALILEQNQGWAAHRYSQVFLGFFLVLRVYEHFLRGDEPCELDALADEIGVPQETLLTLSEYLVEHRVLVEDAQRLGCYTLAKHPSLISLQDLAQRLYAKEFPGEMPLLDSLGQAERSGSYGEGGISVLAQELLRAALRGYFSPFVGKTLEDLDIGVTS
ncbi:YihY/virulence factor BrkB family protein [Desulfosoma caldarium]|uniref:YihY family inner membrane protein n=1 Tax=Desulfosoma caldarium TaxID=610254 RepID=A0A3N1UQY8_9BACT|nr:YihY/virulence factor BrkB family protein [Desulfosoma caldarium]ROQ90957.1 YihY family inner membrane protein [Desulfosoma caldarium]